MKKIFIVVVLFALPIVAYLFFASGVHNFAKLPTLTEEVHSLDNFRTLEGDSVSLQKNITILGFFGEKPMDYAGHSYNLAEKIYDGYFKFRDFQLLIAVPEGSQAEAAQLQKEIAGLVDTRKWKFIFASPEEIKTLFSSLQTDLELNEQLATQYVFILDKNGNLRGRTDDEDTGTLYGYDTSSVAILDDKMNDDVKVILAEYRLALKKYNEENKQ